MKKKTILKNNRQAVGEWEERYASERCWKVPQRALSYRECDNHNIRAKYNENMCTSGETIQLENKVNKAFSMVVYFV